MEDDKRVVAHIVRSDGASFDIGTGTEWRIPNEGLENWANLPCTVNAVEIPNHDGAIITSKRVGSVDRTITAVAHGSNDGSAARAEAIQFFNPKYSYKVYMTYRGRTRWCEGEQIGFMASEGNVYRDPELSWTILCPNPYLKSVDDFGKDIAGTEGGFGFPWVSFIPEDSNTYTNDYAVWGFHTFSDTLELYNDGDVPSGAVITITCTADSDEGWVYSPSINVNGSVVKFSGRAMSEDMTIVIDTVSMPPRVTCTYASTGATINYMSNVTRDSNLLGMRMDPGKNIVTYDADGNRENMHVTISYHKQYLGV